jgi:hypothetical protein
MHIVVHFGCKISAFLGNGKTFFNENAIIGVSGNKKKGMHTISFIVITKKNIVLFAG